MKKINKEYLALGGLIAVTLFSGAALSSIRVSADDSVVDDVAITVPVSCSLSGTGNDSHAATIPNGIYSGNYSDTDSGVDYTNGIGTTTLKAYCNDNNGFAIYAAGYTGNEIGGENSNKLVGNPSTIGNIVTGTATGPVGGVDTSNWAMKLTAASGTYAPTIVGSSSDTEKEANTPDFSNFTEVPNEYTRVAYRNSTTDLGTNAEGSILTTTYAVYISKTQPAGTYSGQVIYTLVHPASSAAPVVCKPNGTTISTIACMQDVTTSNITTILASMTEDQQYTLTDMRDNKTYYVAKLKDGNLWMTQNLDHDIDTTYNYTNDNTDIGWNTTTNTYNTASWTPARSTYETGTTTWGLYDEGEDWYYGYAQPESYDPGDVYWNGTESDYSDWDAYWNSCNYDTTPATCDESLNPYSTYVSTTGDAHYHLGNYYNWSAAVAMNDTSSLTTNGTLVEQSICPAGWTLPRAGWDDNWEDQRFSEDTFKALWDKYGFTSYSYEVDQNEERVENGDALWTSPLYFAASGYWSGMLDDVGYGGLFWSPVVKSGGSAWYAYFFADGGLTPSDGSHRDGGYSVRCVARPVVSAN